MMKLLPWEGKKSFLTLESKVHVKHMSNAKRFVAQA